MRFIVVVNDPKDWPLELPGDGAVVAARTYLVEPAFAEQRGLRVFNLCRSYRYQSTGYYVSLLASARGHRPFPDLETVLAVRHAAVVRATVGDELQAEFDRAFARLKGTRFVLSIYFGRNPTSRYDRLAGRLFAQFPLPFMRARFLCRDGHWQMERLDCIAAREVPADHADFVRAAAERFFARRQSLAAPRRISWRYELAVLVDPSEPTPPSDADALARLGEVCRHERVRMELIGRDDLTRLPAFDGLFIRATTNVDHYTYQFARRAEAEGLVVIDDPRSILRCTNKVYLKELLDRYRVRTPRTLLAHRGNVDAVAGALGFPCVIKQPDSGFSLGVVKVEDRDHLAATMKALLKDSDLLVAQEYLPTDFDWRIGVLGREPLFACRYGMAEGHWQIIKRDEQGSHNGWHETLPLDAVPPAVVKAALRAAGAIGDGFYGVDLKEAKGGPVVIEVNDNPNLDGDVEDQIGGSSIYRRIVAHFVERIERSRELHHG